MVLLRFRAPNIGLGCKCFEMPVVCQMVYNPDSVRLLVKLRVPIIEKCLFAICYLLRMLNHLLNNVSFAKMGSHWTRPPNPLLAD